MENFDTCLYDAQKYMFALYSIRGIVNEQKKNNWNRTWPLWHISADVMCERRHRKRHQNFYRSKKDKNRAHLPIKAHLVVCK